MPFDGNQQETEREQNLIRRRARDRQRKARNSASLLAMMISFFENGERWIKGTHYDGKGNYCLMGYLHHLRKDAGREDRASVYMVQAIDLLHGRQEKVADFNDGCTSVDEVRLVLDAAYRLVCEEAYEPGEAEGYSACIAAYAKEPLNM